MAMNIQGIGLRPHFSYLALGESDRAIGNLQFKEQIERLTGLRVSARKRGRPKGDKQLSLELIILR